MKEIRKCVICGSEFSPYNRRHICCGISCYKQRKRDNARRLSETAKYREYQRLRAEKNSRKICIICGKIIEPVRNGNGRLSSLHMHDECVLKDCIGTLKAGERLSHTQYQRAYARGYELVELQEMALNEILEETRNLN